MATLAIIGRPNTGKSTLFNRLTGSRRALVHDMPGVTRDRIEGQGRLFDLEFGVIDTAGLETGPEESLAGRLRLQTLAGLAAADLGLFLIDSRAGITPLDHEIAAWLRKSEKPVILVANKAEGAKGYAGLAEAWELGLGEPVAISAEHAEGMGDLADVLRAQIERIEAGLADRTPPQDLEDGFRLAVVGRPNAGKSSLINRLIDDDRLLTGPEPGLTRDSIEISWRHEGRRIDLVDTAGLRRRARIDMAVEKIAASMSIRAIRQAHAVLLLMDATQPFEHQDLTIANLAIDEGRALVIALNKWDLIEDKQALIKELSLQVEERLHQVKGLRLVPISALTGRGLDKLLPAVVAAVDRWQTRVPTAKLNAWLKEALERHPPPLVQKRRLKIRYMTQAATRPPTFLLFANKPAKMVPESYLRYLAGTLRETFGLEGVPLRLQVRHGENPYDKG